MKAVEACAMTCGATSKGPTVDEVRGVCARPENPAVRPAQQGGGTLAHRDVMERGGSEGSAAPDSALRVSSMSSRCLAPPAVVSLSGTSRQRAGMPQCDIPTEPPEVNENPLERLQPDFGCLPVEGCAALADEALIYADAQTELWVQGAGAQKGGEAQGEKTVRVRLSQVWPSKEGDAEKGTESDVVAPGAGIGGHLRPVVGARFDYVSSMPESLLPDLIELGPRAVRAAAERDRKRSKGSEPILHVPCLRTPRSLGVGDTVGVDVCGQLLVGMVVEGAHRAVVSTPVGGEFRLSVCRIDDDHVQVHLVPKGEVMVERAPSWLRPRLSPVQARDALSQCFVFDINTRSGLKAYRHALMGTMPRGIVGLEATKTAPMAQILQYLAEEKPRLPAGAERQALCALVLPAQTQAAEPEAAAQGRELRGKEARGAFGGSCDCVEERAQLATDGKHAFERCMRSGRVDGVGRQGSGRIAVRTAIETSAESPAEASPETPEPAVVRGLTIEGRIEIEAATSEDRRDALELLRDRFDMDVADAVPALPCGPFALTIRRSLDTDDLYRIAEAIDRPVLLSEQCCTSTDRLTRLINDVREVRDGGPRGAQSARACAELVQQYVLATGLHGLAAVHRALSPGGGDDDALTILFRADLFSAAVEDMRALLAQWRELRDRRVSRGEAKSRLSAVRSLQCQVDQLLDELRKDVARQQLAPQQTQQLERLCLMMQGWLAAVVEESAQTGARSGAVVRDPNLAAIFECRALEVAQREADTVLKWCPAIIGADDDPAIIGQQLQRINKCIQGIEKAASRVHDERFLQTQSPSRKTLALGRLAARVEQLNDRRTLCHLTGAQRKDLARRLRTGRRWLGNPCTSLRRESREATRTALEGSAKTAAYGYVLWERADELERATEGAHEEGGRRGRDVADVALRLERYYGTIEHVEQVQKALRRAPESNDEDDNKDTANARVYLDEAMAALERGRGSELQYLGTCARADVLNLLQPSLRMKVARTVCASLRSSTDVSF